jgi:serine/threonine-protein kinase RsbW
MPGSHTPSTVTSSDPLRTELRDRLRRPVVRYRGASTRDVSMRVALPRATWTVPVARRMARHLLRHRLIGEDCRTAVELALCEACSNAVRHAAPATHYKVWLRIRQTACLVEVTDTGTGFELAQQAVMPDVEAVSGRGLALIAQLTDRLEILRERPTGTLLRFVKHLSPQPVQYLAG